MKFTKFFAVALAAATIVSCSKEKELPNPERPLAPGEARIMLDLGNGGATTYSTKELESKLLNQVSKLYHSDGKEITMTGITLDPATGKFSATVPSASVAEAGTNDVTLYVNLNVLGKITEGTTAGATAQANHESAKTTTVINRDLQNGAPARSKVTFKLKEGVISVPAAKAKRVIARLEAKSGNGMSIAGFTVSASNANLSAGAPLAYSTAASTTVGTESFSYKLVSDGKGGNTATTNGFETIAYMYPSAKVNLKVTPPTGTARDVEFTPIANRNYAVKITPTTTTDGTIDFTVSIDEWDNTGGDIDADFSKGKLAMSTTYNVNGVSVEAGNKLKIGFSGKNASVINSLSDLYPNYKAELAAGTVTFKFENLTSKLGQTLTFTTDGTKQLTINGPVIYTNDQSIFSVKVTVSDKANTVLESNQFDMIFQGEALPANYLVDMGVAQFTLLAEHNTMRENIDAVKAVNANATTGGIYEKLTAVIKSSPAQYRLRAGTKFKYPVASPCPAGFTLPSKAIYKALLADTFNTGGNTVYGVKEMNLIEDITDADGKIVSTERKVGVMLSGHTDTDRANKSYRVFQYKDNKLILHGNECSPTGFYSVFLTSEGPIHTHNVATGKNVYQNGAALTNGQETYVRCIKDTNAKNVVW